MATRSGPKRMSQLALGEQVLAVDPSTGHLQFSPIYMWSSRRPAQASQYVTVHTDAGLNITGAAERREGYGPLCIQAAQLPACRFAFSVE